MEEVGEQERNLGGVGVSVPEQLLQDLDLFPESYRTNSPDEVRLLAVADNFLRQYSHICPERKPLLLCPVNEFGVKKFVCTTLQPTPTSFPDLFTWEGCASFVADFLSLHLLQPPTALPRYLFSSTCVLHTQRATCLEFTTLLCSLLLGVNYDAYCVSGYALREMCLLDQSLQDCPLLDAQVQSEISEEQQEENKYMVKPQKELKSYFLLQQEEKKQNAEAESLKQQLQEEPRQRSADPLHGLRVHCWVLVLAGSRSVQENFFIDPLTGKSYSTSDGKFLGIESVWNNLNYYVNMQDCSRGCTNMVFDLEDLRMWEPVLFGATSKKQLNLDVLKKKETKLTRKVNMDDEEEDEEEPCVLEMPRSWVSYIDISKKDLETRWPGGQKVTKYRRAKLEKFAPYLRPDGLVTRLTAYRDLDCTEISAVKNWYQNRNDHLDQRDVDLLDGFTTETFKHGRCFNLLVHRYKSETSEFNHEMRFSVAHLDNLVRRVVSSTEMTEVFEGRSDFLHYRHVVFDGSVPFSRRLEDPEGRCVQKVVERFHRDRSTPASKDVAERVFLRARSRIELTYHLEDYRFIPSQRSFIKPQLSPNQKKEDLTPALVSSFQVDSSEKPLNTLTLCNMLQDLLRAEEQSLLQINRSSKEVRDITACREEEERHIQLLFSPWTPTGAARVRDLREEIERRAVEKHRWLREDNLAPFLMRLSNTETLSVKDARQVHKDCLADFKQRLVDEANLIQERHEKATVELQQKQAWYQKNQLQMTKEQEEQYQSYCAEKMLQIHVAKKRLSLHKESAAQKLKSFDQKLRKDPRLAPHLLS